MAKGTIADRNRRLSTDCYLVRLLTGARLDIDTRDTELAMSTESTPFHKLGERNVTLCRELGGLEPDDFVLDLSCGVGRTAAALTQYISAAGRYTGLDIVPFAIDWCNENIAPRHRNFSFVREDPENGHQPDKLFPFDDGRFTFALAGSLFTRILPPKTQRYIAEASSLLKPGGRFLSTWFLLDDAAEAGMAAGRSQISFPHVFAEHAQRSLYPAEQAVAYRRGQVEQMLSEASFAIDRVHRGKWSGAQTEIDFIQDVIIARRAKR
jgi:SAM-dependent methyltransferase